jgi:lysozyme family protein
MASKAATVADYDRKFSELVTTRPAETDAAARRILKNWAAYKEVEAATGVPAYFVGVLHMRECNNDMRGCLANGEKIIGTNRKTRIVPKGRGPYATFLESAIDALEIDGLTKIKDWSPGVALEAGERFNGLGYRGKAGGNPYLWGSTQFYKRGKYVRDHVYSSTFVDPQLGIAPVMKRVVELAPKEGATSFVARFAAKRAENKAAAKEAAPRLSMADEFFDYVGLGGLGLGTLLNQLGAFVVDWRTLALLGAGGSLWLGVKAFKFYARRKLTIPAADGVSNA